MRISILILALTGCSVSKFQMDRADALCECNGGTSLYVVGSDYEIHCVNGARFSRK